VVIKGAFPIDRTALICHLINFLIFILSNCLHTEFYICCCRRMYKMFVAV